MKISYAPGTHKERDLLEPGDLMAFEGRDTHLLYTEIEGTTDNCGYVDLDTGFVSMGFKHPTHLINHVKKHYGTYVLIKSRRVELTVHGWAVDGS